MERIGQGNRDVPGSGTGAGAEGSYLFTLTDGGGTVPPELGVALRLVARGHRVTVFGDPSMADAAADTGAGFRP